jgi:hypothetical protein
MGVAVEMSRSNGSRLTRYSTSTLPRYFGYLAGSWYLVSLGMLFMVQGYEKDHGLRALYMWSALLALPAIEALIAGLLVSSTKTFLLRSKSAYLYYAGVLCLLVTGVFLTLSLFCF